MRWGRTTGIWLGGHLLSRTLLILLALLLFFLSSVVFVDRRLKPTLLQIAEARARVIATRAINGAINEKMVRSMRYEDLYSIKTDARGKIVFMQPNTGEINRLASETTIQVQEALKSIADERIRIPLGQVLGSQLFASFGPWIQVKIVPIGTVETFVRDKYEQAGINQTRHKLYMEVQGTIKIVVPLITANVVVRTEVPITEGVIVGEVPQVYLGIDGGTLNQLKNGSK
ncbi:MAG: sporulation protein YunB [Syntrophothermus sp.]